MDRYAPSISVCSRARRSTPPALPARVSSEPNTDGSGASAASSTSTAPNTSAPSAIGSQHAQAAARLALRRQRDAELRDQADRVDVELRPAAAERGGQRRRGRCAGCRAGLPVAETRRRRGGRRPAARRRTPRRRRRRRPRPCAASRPRCRRGGGLVGGACQQLLARQRLGRARGAPRAWRARAPASGRPGRGACRRRRRTARSRRKAISDALVERAGDQRRGQHARARPGRAGADRTSRATRSRRCAACRRPARRSRPARRRRSGCRRSAAARLDAVGVAQDEVGVTPPPDAQPGAVGVDQCAGRDRRRPGRSARRRRGRSTSPAISVSAANWSAPEAMVFYIAQSRAALECDTAQYPAPHMAVPDRSCRASGRALPRQAGTDRRRRLRSLHPRAAGRGVRGGGRRRLRRRARYRRRERHRRAGASRCARSASGPATR